MGDNPFSNPDDPNEFEDGKFVGGYVPRQLVDDIGLYAMYHNTSRSYILQRSLEDFLKKAPASTTMINELAKRAYNEWQRRYKKNRFVDGWLSREEVAQRFEEFKDEAVQRLRKRKVSEDYIVKIIEKIGVLK